MNLPLKNFILDDSLLFSAEHIKDALDYPHVMSLVVLDLESLAMETRRAGEKAMIDKCLSPMELQQFGNFSYGKRKNEWLGGRISAKIAAAKCMAASDIGEKKPIAWQNLSIESQESGRPFVLRAYKTRDPKTFRISPSRTPLTWQPQWLSAGESAVLISNRPAGRQSRSGNDSAHRKSMKCCRAFCLMPVKQCG